MIKFLEVDEKFLKYDAHAPQMPVRATKTSVCYDFFSPIDVTLPAHKITLVFTNVKAIFDGTTALILATRSSMGLKGITLANGIGIIESDYANNPSNDGNLGFALFNTTDNDYVIKRGEKLGQGMFIPFLTVTDEAEITTTRTGGFGSTGNK